MENLIFDPDLIISPSGQSSWKSNTKAGISSWPVIRKDHETKNPVFLENQDKDKGPYYVG